MLTWLFLLLPIAAFSGWMLARRHYSKKATQKESPFNPAYFKGLNYLLNEQPDKAIDVFISLLEVNTETVETHLALANLFRRRGETDRAIRVHQNLIARPSLTHEQRTQALVELGLDYMNAGVLDRAEQLFVDLLQTKPIPPEAPKQLLRIYQQQKDWLNAIKMAELIHDDPQLKTNILIAQFYCELAETATDQDKSQAHQYIKKAHQYDKRCVRATLIESRLLIKDKHYKKAQRTLENIEHQNVEFLPEALPLLYHCYTQSDNLHQFKNWLTELLKRHPNLTSARILLTKVIRRLEGDSEAQNYLYRELHTYPSVEGLHHLIQMDQENHQAVIPLIHEVTTNLLHKGDKYTCKNCGFSGRTMHWHCPGCAKWVTMRPIEIHLSALEKLLESNR